ncbi:MAG: hypothetical protein LOD85_05920 [Clostridia bacterium]|nr:hypothetical protein [Bacillota bacterium]MBO2520601.1 hypothetical protein [Bacillota bacterium]
MARKVALWALAVLLALGTTLTAAAQDGTVARLPVDVPGTNVVFMSVRWAPPGQTLYDVRAEIWKRLVEVLAQAERSGVPVSGQSVSVELPEDGDPRILVNGMLIVEVDARHAELNLTTQEGLAQVWAANLARALDRWAEINSL